MHVTPISTRRIAPARRAAFAVLEAVANGQYASDVLRAESRSLAARDASLASQIVFGCLRWTSQLDFLVTHYSGRRPDKLDQVVLLALRSAIFQLRYLERVPAHAAVHESVEFVKAHKRSASGLVNAVLRKVNRQPVSWPDLATELSCPQWLLERWSLHFDAQTARGIASAALLEPETFLRIPAGTPLPAGLDLEPTEVPGAYKLLSDLPAQQRTHDVSSQSVVSLLALGPEHTFLDLCAAPGNKTLQALEASPARAIACDVSLKRLREVPAVCPRVALDASQALPFAARFDRIFIDAPCSGTGTLGRNPEIKWRLQAADLPRFQERQSAILRQAASVLAARGRILYATCSLEREENEDVIRQFLELHSDFQLIEEKWRIPGRDRGDGFYAAVLARSS